MFHPAVIRDAGVMCDLLTGDGRLDRVSKEGSHFPGVCIDQVTSVATDSSAGDRSLEVSGSGDNIRLALTLMRLVSFLCGFGVWLGWQLNSARYKRFGVSDPQARVVSVDESGLMITDTQSPIADEFSQDSVDSKQSP